MADLTIWISGADFIKIKSSFALERVNFSQTFRADLCFYLANKIIYNLFMSLRLYVSSFDIIEHKTW